MNESESFIEMPDPNAGDYEPTEKEIEDYAEWLGADIKTDRDLFWIAREALKAKIPPGWKLYQRKDGSGDPFYFNSETGESLWDHPLDAHYKQLFADEKKKKVEALKNQKTLQTTATSNIRPLAQIGKTTQQQQNQNSYKSNTSSLPPKTLLNYKQNILPKSAIQASNQMNALQKEKEDAEMQMRVDIEAIKRKSKMEQDTLISQNQNEIEAITREHNRRMDELKEKFRREEEEYKDKIADIQKKTDHMQDEYRETVNKYNKLIDNAHDDYVDQKKKIDQECQEYIDKAKQDKEDEIKRIKEQLEKEIEQMKEKQKDQINDLQNNSSAPPSPSKSFSNIERDLTKEQAEKIKNIREKFAKEIQQLQQNHDKEVKNIKSSHSDEINQMKKDNSDEIIKLKKQHADEIEQIKKEHQENKANIENTPKSQKQILSLDDSDSFSIGRSITLDVTDASLLHDIEQKNKKIEADYARQLNEKKKQLEDQYAKETKELTERHNKEMEDLKCQHQKEIDEIKEENQKEIDELKEVNQKEIEEVKQNAQKEKKDLISKNKQEIDKITKEHEEEIEELKEDLDSKKEELKDEFENEIEKMKRSQQRRISRRKQQFEEDSEEESSGSPFGTPRASTSSRKEQMLKRELDNLKEQYNTAVATQEQQKVQLEQAQTNFKLQLELLQAKFDVEKQQTEIAHQKEMDAFKQTMGSTTSSPPSSPAWLRFASFQQFQREPSTPLSLKMSKATSYSMKYIPNLMFTTINIFNINPAFNQTVNIGPKPLNIFTETFPPPNIPQTARPFVGGVAVQKEYATGLNQKLLRQMKNQQSKLEKVREKFDANYDQLSVSMKEAIADVYNLINGYKNLISEQNKSLSQIAIDFQQQTSKMARNFRESIAEVENSYKLAMTNAISPTYVPASSPRSARRQNKIQITTPSTDFTSEDSGEEAIRNFLIWRKQQKSNRRRQKYVDNF